MQALSSFTALSGFLHGNESLTEKPQETGMELPQGLGGTEGTRGAQQKYSRQASETDSGAYGEELDSGGSPGRNSAGMCGPGS